MTLSERVASVAAAPNVLDVYLSKAAERLTETSLLHHARATWYYLANGIVQDGGGALIITNYGQPQEAAYWHNSLPQILAVPDVGSFIVGRTTPFTKAQVETFCNAQWRGTANNSAALAVKEFSASNVDNNTIRVTGLFHDVATNQRQRLTYLITLVDANGATTGANVKFEKVVE